MPKKAVRQHGTQAGEQTQTEFYKSLANYKTLVQKNDNITKKLEDIYEDNIWKLKDKFEELKEYYEQIGVSDIIAWNKGVQYLNFPPAKVLSIRPTSIQALKRRL